MNREKRKKREPSSPMRVTSCCIDTLPAVSSFNQLFKGKTSDEEDESEEEGILLSFLDTRHVEKPHSGESTNEKVRNPRRDSQIVSIPSFDFETISPVQSPPPSLKSSLSSLVSPPYGPSSGSVDSTSQEEETSSKQSDCAVGYDGLSSPGVYETSHRERCGVFLHSSGESISPEGRDQMCPDSPPVRRMSSFPTQLASPQPSRVTSASAASIQSAVRSNVAGQQSFPPRHRLSLPLQRSPSPSGSNSLQQKIQQQKQRQGSTQRTSLSRPALLAARPSGDASSLIALRDSSSPSLDGLLSTMTNHLDPTSPLAARASVMSMDLMTIDEHQITQFSDGRSLSSREVPVRKVHRWGSTDLYRSICFVLPLQTTLFLSIPLFFLLAAWHTHGSVTAQKFPDVSSCANLITAVLEFVIGVCGLSALFHYPLGAHVLVLGLNVWACQAVVMGVTSWISWGIAFAGSNPWSPTPREILSIVWVSCLMVVAPALSCLWLGPAMRSLRRIYSVGGTGWERLNYEEILENKKKRGRQLKLAKKSFDNSSIRNCTAHQASKYSGTKLYSLGRTNSTQPSLEIGGR